MRKSRRKEIPEKNLLAGFTAIRDVHGVFLIVFVAVRDAINNGWYPTANICQTSGLPSRLVIELGKQGCSKTYYTTPAHSIATTSAAELVGRNIAVKIPHVTWLLLFGTNHTNQPTA